MFYSQQQRVKVFMNWVIPMPLIHSLNKYDVEHILKKSLSVFVHSLARCLLPSLTWFFLKNKSVLLLLGTGERGGISLSHQFLIACGSLLPDLYVSICFPGSEREQEGKWLWKISGISVCSVSAWCQGQPVCCTAVKGTAEVSPVVKFRLWKTLKEWCPLSVWLRVCCPLSWILSSQLSDFGDKGEWEKLRSPWYSLHSRDTSDLAKHAQVLPWFIQPKLTFWYGFVLGGKSSDACPTRFLVCLNLHRHFRSSCY